jgi:hypothetical protein
VKEYQPPRSARPFPARTASTVRRIRSGKVRGFEPNFERLKKLGASC